MDCALADIQVFYRIAQGQVDRGDDGINAFTSNF